MDLSDVDRSYIFVEDSVLHIISGLHVGGAVGAPQVSQHKN
jgi:hypothetical protein